MKRLLIANRGEIACRIIETCRRLGIETVAVYSDADQDAMHVRRADQAIRIGGPHAADSYLNGSAVIDAAKATGADAIHPGYGFLSENAAFARDVIDNAITWVGPSPRSMELMADKIEAKRLMKQAHVPVLPGSDHPVESDEQALEVAQEIGYPVIIKAAGGGGGMGMKVASSPEEVTKHLNAAKDMAARYFGNAAVYIEKYVESAKHVEAQVLGLRDGTVVVVGDRDCTVQRRNQKVLEEAPCPVLSDEERAQLYQYAQRAAESVDYLGAGTIEMLLDINTRKMYFLEMNTRLQVEHTVTEMVAGIDLVQAQLWIADGDGAYRQPLDQLTTKGHAIEFRIYAEDPRSFMPGPGKIVEWVVPEGEGIRIDTGYEESDEVTPFYDPLIAKLCVYGSTRDEAISVLQDAVSKTTIVGPKNNVDLARVISNDPAFRESLHDTSLLSKII